MELIIGISAGGLISFLIGWFFYWLPKRDARKQPLAIDPNRLPGGRTPKAEWPKIDNLPEAPREIIGREGAIERVAEMVEDAHIAAITGARENKAVVRGPGGIGKTELASEYARRTQKSYEGVWVIPAESEATLHESLATLGRRVGCDPAPSPKQTALDALDAVRGRGAPWLLLFDNAPDQKTIAPYLKSGEGLHCLITSRHGQWQGIADYPLDTLPQDKALDLLREVAGDEVRDFAPVLAVLDGYPLALVAAGAWFAEHPEATPAQYLAEFDQRLKDPLEDGSYKPMETGDVPPSIYGSISLSIKGLMKDAQDLLRLAAYLSPDDLWLEMIRNEGKFSEGQSRGAHDWPDFVTRVAENPARLEGAVAALMRASLVKREGERVTLHRLTQAVMRARLAGHGARWADAAVRMVNAFATDTPNEPSQWSRYARLLPQGEALLPHALPSPASGRAFGQIGGYLHARGDYPGAIRFLECALEISGTVNGEGSALHALRSNNLASSYGHDGQWDAAEPLYEQAIKIDEAVLGDHPQTATHINNLASLHWRRKAFAKAEPLGLRAEAMTKTALGEGHPSYAVRLGTLGVLYDDWAEQTGEADKRALAVEYSQKALTVTRRALGERHPETATRLNNLAVLHHRTRNWHEAVPFMRRVLAIWKDLDLPDHMNMQSSISSFAAILTARDGNDSAVAAEFAALPDEINAMRAEHVKWAVEKLHEIAGRYGLAATDIQAITEAVQADAARLEAEGAPDQKWSWPLTEWQGVAFALLEAQNWAQNDAS